MKSGDDGEAEGAPANEAEGRSPKDPGITLDSSESLKNSQVNKTLRNRDRAHMSPKRFSVKMTPFNFLGFDTMNMAAESTS